MMSKLYNITTVGLSYILNNTTTVGLSNMLNNTTTVGLNNTLNKTATEGLSNILNNITTVIPLLNNTLSIHNTVMSTTARNNETNSTATQIMTSPKLNTESSLYSNDSTWPDYEYGDYPTPAFYSVVMALALFVVGIATVLNGATVVALIR